MLRELLLVTLILYHQRPSFTVVTCDTVDLVAINCSSGVNHQKSIITTCNIHQKLVHSSWNIPRSPISGVDHCTSGSNDVPRRQSHICLHWVEHLWYLITDGSIAMSMTKTSQVINKFFSKVAQDHATYLPGLVCKYVFGLHPSGI